MYISERGPPMTIPTKSGPGWPSSVRGDFHDVFAKFSILSHGGHLFWLVGWVLTYNSERGPHTRAIPAKFGPNWPSSFRGEY